MYTLAIPLLYLYARAFGDEIAQTDDLSSLKQLVPPLSYPHSKQINLGLLLGPRFLANRQLVYIKLPS